MFQSSSRETDVRKFRILGARGFLKVWIFLEATKSGCNFRGRKSGKFNTNFFPWEKLMQFGSWTPKGGLFVLWFAGLMPAFFFSVVDFVFFLGLQPGRIWVVFPYKWLIVNRVVILTILPKCDDHPNNPPRKPQPTLGFDHCSNCDQIWPGIVRWWLISADGAMLQLNGMIFQIIIWATKKQTLVVYCILVIILLTQLYRDYNTPL